MKFLPSEEDRYKLNQIANMIRIAEMRRVQATATVDADTGGVPAPVVPVAVQPVVNPPPDPPNYSLPSQPYRSQRDPRLETARQSQPNRSRRSGAPERICMPPTSTSTPANGNESNGRSAGLLQIVKDEVVEPKMNDEGEDMESAVQQEDFLPPPPPPPANIQMPSTSTANSVNGAVAGMETRKRRGTAAIGVNYETPARVENGGGRGRRGKTREVKCRMCYADVVDTDISKLNHVNNE